MREDVPKKERVIHKHERGWKLRPFREPELVRQPPPAPLHYAGQRLHKRRFGQPDGQRACFGNADLRRSRRHCGSTLRRRGRRRSSTSRTAKAPTARPPLSHFSFRAAPFGLLGHFNSGVDGAQRCDRPCWLHGAFKVAEIVPKRLERVTLTTDLRGGAHPPLAEKGDGRAPALKRVLKQEPSRGP